MGHTQAWDASVYWCVLLFFLLLLWLHPSSSACILHHLFIVYPHCWTRPFAYCVPQWFLPGLSTLLFPLFICSVFEAGVSGSWPLITAGLQLTCMTGCSGLRCPTTGMQGAESASLCIFGKGSPTYTWPFTVYLKHIEVKDSFHLHKLPKCGRDYCRKWRWPVVPTPNSFSWPFLHVYHLLSHFLSFADQSCS